MADLQALIRAIDELDPQEFDQLYHYVAQRRRSVHWWIVPQKNITKVSELASLLQQDSANMTEEEINTVIDESLAEVRHERRKNQSSH